MSELETQIELLHRYHDGELHGFERWLLQRRLRRSPALRVELESLERVSAAVRAQVAQEADGSLETPDIFSAIAANLSAIDAQVADEAARASAAPARAQPAEPVATSWPEWLGGWRAGTAALAAAAAVALVMVLSPGDGTEPGVPPALVQGNGVVRYIDSGGAPVMMIDREDVTIVWMMDAV